MTISTEEPSAAGRVEEDSSNRGGCKEGGYRDGEVLGGLKMLVQTGKVAGTEPFSYEEVARIKFDLTLAQLGVTICVFGTPRSVPLEIWVLGLAQQIEFDVFYQLPWYDSVRNERGTRNEHCKMSCSKQRFDECRVPESQWDSSIEVMFREKCPDATNVRVCHL